MIMLPTQREAKDQAKRLRRALADRGFELGHSQTLELIATTHGLRDWNTLSGLAPADPARQAPAPVLPILRIFDWRATRSFYVDFLGWTVDSEVQSDGHALWYVRLSGSHGERIHLSAHHGDGTPGTAVLIEVPDAAAVHAELTARDYGYAKPGLEDTALGRTVTVHDPCGNRITYVEPGVAVADRVPDELAPIVHEVVVDLDPDAAFDRFTSFSWWRNYGLAPDGHPVLENGEVIFRNPGGDNPIGTITAWQRGSRYAQTFTLAQDPDYPSTLTVTFRPDGDRTRVRFEHGGWNGTNADRRGHFAEWPIILAGFAAGH
ncbi:glyoxalase superfamily protein [Microlunatus speluncae]|uniref:glyoxalase superfamily protein n=1 Tax=Microlunatus speluncae TaxID=2594267 RepID=UPI00137610B0|nr:glyoxalase superfamily protein [Microlunatus speluncae]